MYRIGQLRWISLCIAVLSSVSWAKAQDTLTAKPKTPADAITVLASGPIHEAFAAPINQQPVEPTPIKKQPPPPLKEDPPQERPDLDSAKWIPGYWSWDAERQDFTWVTGVYRAAPEGRTYVPGYWENSKEGYRWIAGFWSNDKNQNLTYTPEPPAPLTSAPKTQAPNDNSLYVPGTWVFSNDRFIWRDGYWTTAQAGRVWVPSQYVWTPNGYIYVDGYWDAPFDARGLAFAPVYFNQPLWQNPNWSFQPNYVINPGGFYNSAFSNGNSYYFGNYYNPLYARLGINPWYTGSGRYDPLFSYYGWQNYRNNPNWIANTRQQYASRAAGQGALPPTTLAQQIAFNGSGRGGFAQISTPAQFHSNHFRLAQTTPGQFNAQRAQGLHIREVAANRHHLETTAARQVSLGNHSAATRNLSMHTVMGGAATHHTTGQPIWQHLNSATHLNHPGGINLNSATHLNHPGGINLNSPTHLNHPGGINLNTHSFQQPHMQQHFAAPNIHHYAAPTHHYSAPIHHAAPAMHHGGGGGHHR